MDIRSKPTLSHDDIVNLNFIRQPCPYVFRPHYREGLRSRLLQVLRIPDVDRESRGTRRHGTRWFPVAQPVAMLRIFKKKFAVWAEVQGEIDNYQLVQRHIPAQHYAASSEFVADYIQHGERQYLLCGLQEFVPGEALDPWHDHARLKLESDVNAQPSGALESALDNLASFIDCIKTMVARTAAIPDLAGVGNLILTPTGEIKLVDINNISKISDDTDIPLDDKQYPVADKSVQALFNLEDRVLKNRRAGHEPLYRFFMDPDRIQAVRRIEIDFQKGAAQSGNYPAVKKFP